MTATAALAAAPSVVLTEAGARALTTRIATQLEHLDELLLTAWRGRIWIALSYPTWDAWVTAELGTVRLRLPVKQRRAVAATWRAEGMSQRAIATGLGVSKGTVATDLSDAPAGSGLAVVVSLDGRRRPAAALLVTRVAPLSRQATVLALLAEAGERGWTVPELMRRMRATQSETSACLSRLNRHLDETGVRAVERLAERRGRHAVYVLRRYASERDTLALGQRVRRS